MLFYSHFTGPNISEIKEFPKALVIFRDLANSWLVIFLSSSQEAHVLIILDVPSIATHIFSSVFFSHIFLMASLPNVNSGARRAVAPPRPLIPQSDAHKHGRTRARELQGQFLKRRGARGASVSGGR